MPDCVDNNGSSRSTGPAAYTDVPEESEGLRLALGWLEFLARTIHDDNLRLNTVGNTDLRSGSKPSTFTHP